MNFNITESFQELSRMALKRNGMERLWRSNKVLSLHELCCHSIVARTNVYNIDKLPLPDAIKANLKSYAMTNSTGLRQALNYKTLKDRKKKSRAPGLDSSGSKKMNLSRKSCVISWNTPRKYIQLEEIVLMLEMLVFTKFWIEK